MGRHNRYHYSASQPAPTLRASSVLDMSQESPQPMLQPQMEISHDKSFEPCDKDISSALIPEAKKKKSHPTYRPFFNVRLPKPSSQCSHNKYRIHQAIDSEVTHSFCPRVFPSRLPASPAASYFETSWHSEAFAIAFPTIYSTFIRHQKRLQVPIS